MALTDSRVFTPSLRGRAEAHSESLRNDWSFHPDRLAPPEDLPLFSVVGLTVGYSLDCIQVVYRRADKLYTHTHTSHIHTESDQLIK